jgi:hypothetical protein
MLFLLCHYKASLHKGSPLHAEGQLEVLFRTYHVFFFFFLSNEVLYFTERQSTTQNQVKKEQRTPLTGKRKEPQKQTNRPTRVNLTTTVTS